ncbi:hypothetical protein Tco_0975094 [Tanacetum coccineum]|uniref:Uncharacterized protein n=1 Tax=Tanacetum coccineum TaxID=301880 RepID=A0ABQ5EDL0_9ASTR
MAMNIWQSLGSSCCDKLQVAYALDKSLIWHHTFNSSVKSHMERKQRGITQLLRKFLHDHQPTILGQRSFETSSQKQMKLAYHFSPFVFELSSIEDMEGWMSLVLGSTLSLVTSVSFSVKDSFSSKRGGGIGGTGVNLSKIPLFHSEDRSLRRWKEEVENLDTNSSHERIEFGVLSKPRLATPSKRKLKEKKFDGGVSVHPGYLDY